VNDQEITASLAASHIAVVATIGRNGTPQLTPNWYRYDGQVLTLITRNDRLKYRNLQRDNRISVCIYDPPVASDYVVISGTATWNDQGILGRGPSDHRTLSGTGRGGRLSRALAHGATGAHHGDPGAHYDTGVQGTVSCHDARGPASRPSIRAH
jgi:Pyridoxamine 5'-phosphate oxidase